MGDSTTAATISEARDKLIELARSQGFGQEQISQLFPNSTQGSQPAAATTPTSVTVDAAQLRAVVAEVFRDQKPDQAGSSAGRTLVHTGLNHQYQLNNAWLKLVADGEAAVLLDDADGVSSCLASLKKAIEDRIVELEICDKDPKAFEKLEQFKRMQELSQKSSLPKAFVESLFKAQDEPSKKRFKSGGGSFRSGGHQPFRGDGLANPGPSAVYYVSTPGPLASYGYQQPPAVAPQFSTPSNRQGGGQYFRRPDNSRGPCYNCGGFGHQKRDCRQRESKDDRRN